jgi:hypothetical protein
MAASCAHCGDTGIIRYDVGKRSEWCHRCPYCCRHVQRYRAPDGVRCETCGALMESNDGS